MPKVLFDKDSNMPKSGPTSNEKIIELDKQLSLFEQQQIIMKEELTEIKDSVKAMDRKLDTITEKLADKYASKWVESAMKWLITAICWWVVTAVLALVLNKP